MGTGDTWPPVNAGPPRVLMGMDPPSMSDGELRFRALELASHRPEGAEDTVARAKVYYEFMVGQQ